MRETERERTRSRQKERHPDTHTHRVCERGDEEMNQTEPWFIFTYGSDELQIDRGE